MRRLGGASEQRTVGVVGQVLAGARIASFSPERLGSWISAGWSTPPACAATFGSRRAGPPCGSVRRLRARPCPAPRRSRASGWRRPSGSSTTACTPPRGCSPGSERGHGRRGTGRAGAPVGGDGAQVVSLRPAGPDKAHGPDAAATQTARHAEPRPAAAQGRPSRSPRSKRFGEPATDGPAVHRRAAGRTPGLPSDSEAALADALAFLRRRMTGDYAVDEFGYDAEFTDHVVLPPLKPLYEKWFRVETSGWSTSRTTAGRWWSPTIPAPSRSTR